LIKFFEYNWQIREDWFNWCSQRTTEELLQQRTGGVGSILHTLFHIVDVEYSWLRAVQGKEVIDPLFDDYQTLEKVKALSDAYQVELVEYLTTTLPDVKDQLVPIPWADKPLSTIDILHHVIAHEIHHIGQLSVWARELDVRPISANFLGRNIKSLELYS
jgi:uncharacterized damage-inducible protein DinB